MSLLNYCVHQNHGAPIMDKSCKNTRFYDTDILPPYYFERTTNWQLQRCKKQLNQKNYGNDHTTERRQRAKLQNWAIVFDLCGLSQRCSLIRLSPKRAAWRGDTGLWWQAAVAGGRWWWRRWLLVAVVRGQNRGEGNIWSWRREEGRTKWKQPCHCLSHYRFPVAARN